MNILVINQPVFNRGDEAAHRSLIRTLNQLLPEAHLTIAIEKINQDTIEQIRVKSPQNTYIALNSQKGEYRFRKFAIKSNFLPLSFLIPSNKIIANHIKNADIIISAPGGMCLGGFYNWNHLFLMMLTQFYHKYTIYYSRSIGPFNPVTKEQKLFVNRSISILSNVNFLSLRDAKSMKTADALHLKYTPSIDSAFLDAIKVDIPTEITRQLKEPYIVFVPNELTWHPQFKSASQEEIDNCYLKIIEIIAENSNCQIVMLPQLYFCKNNDYAYFNKLKNKSKYQAKILVVEDKYSSDIQQCIIEKSQLLIGARYHSVIFGLNRSTPVIALNYEHKIEGVLDLLNVKDSIINFKNINDIRNFDFTYFRKLFEMKLKNKETVSYKEKARKMAMECLLKAINNLKQQKTWK